MAREAGDDNSAYRDHHGQSPRWTPERVLSAAAAWERVPPDAVDQELDGYRLTYYPDRTSVRWSRSERPVAELVDDMLAKGRADGRASLRWWVNDATRPADTEAELRSRGFLPAETVDVLAWELGAGEEPRLPAHRGRGAHGRSRPPPRGLHRPRPGAVPPARLPVTCHRRGRVVSP